MPDDQARVRDVARNRFGHDELLPGQEEATTALLEGYDVLLVAPTGAGKSLVYQVAGVLVKGLTLVVSPILALQKDQIEGITLGGRGLHAARLSSAETASERDDAFRRAAAGELDYLFLAPEQLANEGVRGEVAQLRPRLVVVDEAHCVSAWGHDFRPDYFRLGDLIDGLVTGEERPRLIAMTATAAPPVRDDIHDRLRLRDARTIVTGFARPNVALTVLRCATVEDQRAAVHDAVQRTAGSVIVYCRTRPAAKEYAALLEAAGRRTALYHAGLGRRKREAAHEEFLAGEVDTIVATSAFGMGIDKPDVRMVVHAQVPESPDTYYQEVGRAGRDGAPASGLLIYRPEDLSLGRFFSPAVPRRSDVRAVLEATSDGAVEPRVVAERSGLGRRKTGTILNLLTLAREARPGEDPIEAAAEFAEAHRNLERSRVEMMRSYAETERCRAEFLLGYFGEPSPMRCDVCDNCRSGLAPEPADESNADFPVQARVRHQEFGDGVVTDVEDDRLTVLFDEVGYRTLALDILDQGDLLRRLRG
ncbi:ATP-dependent DNA helicase RecQ [Nocardioides sp. DS6]|uniref:ATP-dependent DNA helicase RecQ n=1 Tax=Nocardioides eburneus TaxID=3231482 RepID=A0ABV3SZ27_9ACTN